MTLRDDINNPFCQCYQNNSQLTLETLKNISARVGEPIKTDEVVVG